MPAQQLYYPSVYFIADSEE